MHACLPEAVKEATCFKSRNLCFTFSRCILNKKAKPVHKTIVDTFSIVAKFSLLLTSRAWEYTEDGEAIHPAMEQMQETYAAFREYSKFLYTGKQF